MTGPSTDAVQSLGGLLGPRGPLLAPTDALRRFDQLLDGRQEPQASVAAERPRRWLLNLGGTRLLLDGDVVGEILDDAAVFPVPRTPDWVAGVINHRGTLVPVFDLALRLSGQRSAAGLLIVLGEDEQAVALSLDELPARRSPDPQAQADPPEDLPPLLADCVRGAYRSDRRLWLDCDHERLIGALAAEAAASPAPAAP